MSLGDIPLVGALAATVASVWIGALALVRLPTALDRLHAVTFLNAASGVFLVAAAFAAEGVTVRSLKLAALVLVLLASGAALSHATGRALLIREGRQA